MDPAKFAVVCTKEKLCIYRISKESSNESGNESSVCSSYSTQLGH